RRATLRLGRCRPAGNGVFAKYARFLTAIYNTLSLIGAALEPPGAAYLAGPRFMHLITFMGCSPFLRLAPEHDQDRSFCHLRLSGDGQTLRFRSGRNTRPPHCPLCRTRIEQWPILMQAWRSAAPCR
ncbi:MAG: hypothetical protein AB2813_01950, partial [Candidatus Sedimenticola endophacoides]